jgi:uncharacterized protein (TIGR00730 family)
VGHYRTGDEQIDAAIDALVAEAGDHEHSDLLREMLTSCMKFMDSGADRADMRQFNAALKELRYATKVFSPYAPVRKVSIFGSARLKNDSVSYKQAVDFSRRMADRDWMVITGAGPGIMQAGNEGAGPEKSFGVNIRLPFEQTANDEINGSPLLVTFKYFFTRKLFFLKESHAIVLFPGGFGTLDEGFETLTLIQTGKNEPIPVVLLDDPGNDYWHSVDTFFREELLGRGLISREDLHFFKVTDNVGDAVGEVTRFYRNYHSSRHTHDRFILRMHRPPDERSLTEVRRDFKWLLRNGEGAIEVHEGALEDEGNDIPEGVNWRLVFPFDRRSYGRLRMLIDRVNDW